MELMIAVAVVAIVAAFAIPSYQRSVQRSYWQAARDILMAIYSGEQVYFAADNKFYAPGVWSKIYTDNPNGVIPVTFSVVENGLTGAAATFTATATYTPNGQTQTVNQNRVFGGTWAQP